MYKPRIIIADRDLSYIIPLQQKLIEEYCEKIELDIITSIEYFEHLFSLPQKADALIVSEELYSPSLQRHEIGQVFVMTENKTSFPLESSVSAIYKYTSIKEIFNAIFGSVIVSADVSKPEEKKTQIILVYSASGGVGKTTIALGVCACLNKSFKRVLYINAERLQSFQSMLVNMSPITDSGVYGKLISPAADIYLSIKHTIRNEGFNYLPPFRASLLSLGLKYSVFEKIAVSAKRANDFDYIVIDADSTFDEDKTHLFDIADKVITVTKQNRMAVMATNVLVSNISRTESSKYIYICNDFNDENANATISSGLPQKFTIDEYVFHIPHYEQLKANEFADNNDIQRVAFLID